MTFPGSRWPSSYHERCGCHRPMPPAKPVWVPSPPATFHQFQMFPEEIRREIWRLSLLPRVIDAHLGNWNGSLGRPSASNPEPASYRGLAPVLSPLPSTFYVCREARGEVKRFYVPFHGSDSFYVAPGTMINFELDILYCASQLFNHEVWKKAYEPSIRFFENQFVPFRLAWDEEVVSKVTRLAMPRTELNIMDPNFLDSCDAVQGLRKFPMLREIILIEPEHLEGHGLRSWTCESFCGDPIPMRFKGPVELVNKESWQPSDFKESAIMTNEFLQVSLVTAWLGKAEARAADGWKAPAITYCGSIRWRDGSKCISATA